MLEARALHVLGRGSPSDMDAILSVLRRGSPSDLDAISPVFLMLFPLFSSLLSELP